MTPVAHVTVLASRSVLCPHTILPFAISVLERFAVHQQAIFRIELVTILAKLGSLKIGRSLGATMIGHLRWVLRRVRTVRFRRPEALMLPDVTSGAGDSFQL